MFVKIRFHKPHSTANVVVTHESRKEQQSATIDLKWCISIVVQTYMYCPSWEIVVQHDNISKPLFTLTHYIPRKKSKLLKERTTDLKILSITH